MFFSQNAAVISHPPLKVLSKGRWDLCNIFIVLDCYKRVMYCICLALDEDWHICLI